MSKSSSHTVIEIDQKDGDTNDAPSTSTYPPLTPAEKKYYAQNPDAIIPLAAIANEFHLLSKACHKPDSNVKNCKHNVHCLHGLGYQKRGIWDGWTTGTKHEPWKQFLGANPSDRAKEVGSKVGLQNLGATCYLNTLFQWLFMDPIFRRAVFLYEPPTSLPSQSSEALTPIKEEPKKDSTQGSADDAAPQDAQQPNPNANRPYIHHLQEIFTHLEYSDFASYNPAHIVNALTLKQHDQQDVHEFMNLLVFQLFDNHLSQSRNPICRQLIPKLFTGKIVHVMEGQGCKHQSESSSEFHDLSSIQIKGKKKLTDCLDQYFKEEYMEDESEDRRWKCGTCHKRENAVRRTYLKDPPPVLILQLGRFEFDFNTLTKKKLGDAIQLPNRIDLAKYIQPPKDTSATTTNGATSNAASANDIKSPSVTASTSPAESSLSEMDVDSSSQAQPKRRGGGRRKTVTPQLEKSIEAGVEAEAAAAKAKKPTPNKRKRTEVADDSAAPPSPVVLPLPPQPQLSSLDALPGRNSLTPMMAEPESVTTVPQQRKRGRASVASKTDEKPTASKRRNTRGSTPPVVDLLEESDGDEERSAMLDMNERPIDLTLGRLQGPSPTEWNNIGTVTQPIDPIPTLDPSHSTTTISKEDPTQTTLDGYVSNPSSPHKSTRTQQQQSPSPEEQPSPDQPDPSISADEAFARALNAQLNDPPKPKRGRKPVVKLPPTTTAKSATRNSVPSSTPTDLTGDDQQPPAKVPRTQRGQTAGSGAKKSVNNVRSSKPAKAAAIAAAEAESKEEPIALPADGDVTDVVTDNSVDPSGQYVYELVAILLHKGTSANRGHYTAEIKDQTTGEWFSFDDTKVTSKALKKKPATTPTTDATLTPSVETKTEASTTAEVESVLKADEPTAMEIDEPTRTATSSDDTDVQIIESTTDSKRPGRGRRSAAASPAASVAEEKKSTRGRGKKNNTEANAMDLAEEEEDVQVIDDDQEEKKEMDVDEEGDEEVKPKKGGKKGKKGAASTKKKAGKKPDAKADVSVGAASTAYILVYRRCNTMQSDWNPFTDEDVQTQLTADGVKRETDESTSAATTPSLSPTTNPPSALSTSFFNSKPPAILLEPVLKDNESLKLEQANYHVREELLEGHLKVRRDEVLQLLERDGRTVEPCDFLEADSAIEQLRAASTVTPPTPISPPSAANEKSSPTTATRSLRARKSTTPTASAATNADSNPLKRPTLPKIDDLNTIELGHYVSTAWLTAYLTGWVIDEKDTTIVTTTNKDDATTAKDETKDEEVKEETKESDSKEVIDVDKDTTMKDESESVAAAPSSTTTEEVKTTTEPAKPPTLTPLQLFLRTHPNNSELPWPGDLIESLETLKCPHGRLNPTKMQSAKRISCKAWRKLLQANQAWKEKHPATVDVTAKIKSDPLSIKVEETKEEIRPRSPASTSSVPSPSLSSICPLPSCHSIGLTDADICQECARDSLLGETILRDLHEKHLRIFTEYEKWNLRQKALEDKNESVVFDNGFLMASSWWKQWKRELDHIAKYLGIATIAPAKKSLKSAATPAAIAKQQQKERPKLTLDVSATEDIRCEHGRLMVNGNAIPIPKNVWELILELFPKSLPVKIDGVGDDGKTIACKDCREQLAKLTADEKGRKEVLKSEKGKLKFIKTLTQIEDFPIMNKPPWEGKHHIVPTAWARKLFYYFQKGDIKRPEPMSTQDLLCQHQKLLYTPYPEEDKSILPSVAAAAEASLQSATISKVNSCPTDRITICDDAEYQHLKAYNWIDESSPDIIFNVKKNPKNVTGDLSSWSYVLTEVSPPPCEECIKQRILNEEKDALDFINERLTIHRLKNDEKIEDELATNAALAEGRRASTRKKAPAAGKKLPPIQVTVSSTDTIEQLKLKIFEASDMDVGHQEIIWIKPDGGLLTLDKNTSTLRDYNLPQNAELRLRLNALGAQEWEDQCAAKGGVEQGFKGTALSSLLMVPVAAQAPTATSATASASSSTNTAASSASPVVTPSATPTSLPSSTPTTHTPAANESDYSPTVTVTTTPNSTPPDPLLLDGATEESGPTPMEVDQDENDSKQAIAPSASPSNVPILPPMNPSLLAFPDSHEESKEAINPLAGVDLHLASVIDSPQPSVPTSASSASNDPIDLREDDPTSSPDSTQSLKAELLTNHHHQSKDNLPPFKRKSARRP